MNEIERFLPRLDEIIASSDGETPYIHPKLKNTGAVSIVLLRNVIAPLIIRNSEEEITDIDVDGKLHVRAVPLKFKYPERNRGLQILRALNAGGNLPQNKSYLSKGSKISEVFDLNTLVFGDSMNHYDKRVLPVKAAVNYSDALSVSPKEQCVDQSFHIRGMEDGTLFDAESKKNTDNLFTTHFVSPGTSLIQVVSTRGKLLPMIGLKHLLLSIGLCGTYGGRTSAIGTNVETQFVGIYGSEFERSVDSPYVLLKKITDAQATHPNLVNLVHEVLSSVHLVSLASEKVNKFVQALVDQFETEDSLLLDEYSKAKTIIGEYFESWFEVKKR